MDFPVPKQTQYPIEVFVTPPPPADATLAPPFAPCQQGSDFHLDVVAYFTEGATGVADPKIVDPSRQRRVDPLNDHLSRERTP